MLADLEGKSAVTCKRARTFLERFDHHELEPMVRVILILEMMMHSVPLETIRPWLLRLADKIPMAAFLLAVEFRTMADQEQDPDIRFVLQQTSTTWLRKAGESLPVARQHLGLHYLFGIGIERSLLSAVHLFTFDANWSNMSYVNRTLLNNSRLFNNSTIRKDTLFSYGDHLSPQTAAWLKCQMMFSCPFISTPSV